MIWRSNITVWNSHDVLLLLLFTSTLGVIIEVNIFYTNTSTRGLSLLRWDLSPSSKHLHWWFWLWQWWPRGRAGLGLVGISVGPGEEILLVVCPFLGTRDVSDPSNTEVLASQTVFFLQWNSGVLIPAAVGGRRMPGFADRKDVFGVWDCKGDCSEHCSDALANFKELETSEVRIALHWKMKM